MLSPCPGPNISVAGSSQPVRGMAATATELFVADTVNSQIKVFSVNSTNPSTSPVRSWNLANPRGIALGRDGSLWILQANDGSSSGAQVVHENSSGGNLNNTITFSSSVAPTAIAVDKSGTTDRVLITDNGQDQNVKIYNTGSLSGSPTNYTTFGAVGGIHSGTNGQVAPLKFSGLTGVGVDSSGNIYVGENNGVNTINYNGDNGYGAVVEKYTSGGTRLWADYGLEFVDSATADPSSESDVYTAQEHFTLDYGAANPGGEWSYTGFTLDRFSYPQDARLYNSLYTLGVRRVGGQKFLYLNDMYSSRVAVYRFNGEVAVPSAYFGGYQNQSWPPNQPSNANWEWVDANGNGQFDAGEFSTNDTDYPYLGAWSVDAAGGVWKVQRNGSLRHFRIGSIAANGVPLFDSYASSEVKTVPSALNDPQRIVYDSANNVMYIGGYDAANPKGSGADGNEGFHVLYRYDNWSTSPTLHAGYPIVMDYTGPTLTLTDPGRDIAVGVDVAGGYIFVAYDSQQKQVKVYNAATGANVGTLTPTQSAVGLPTAVGFVDIPNALHAYARSNGEYLVFLEEDELAKVLMYRWIPSGTTTVATPTFSPAGGTYSSVQTVTLSDSTSGAAIHYTTDGSTPTISSPTYTGTLSVSATATIKAIGTQSGSTNSAVASATYTINTGGTATVYEAESGTLAGSAQVYTDANRSGGKFVGNFQVGASDTLTGVNGGSGGSASLVITYSADTGRRASLYVNGTFVQKINWGSGTYGTWRDQAPITVTLNAGTGNTIKVSQDSDDSGAYVCADLDKLTVTTSSAPAAPTGLSAVAGNTQVSLSWTASSGATSYNVYRGTAAGGESVTPIATGVTSTSYLNTGLTNGTVYYYKVAAVNAGGTSGYSNEASVTPVAPTPTSYEAEAAANTLGNGAFVDVNSGASGGHVVRYIGGSSDGYDIVNNVNVTTAGTHTLTVYFFTGNRNFQVSVNGGTDQLLTCSGASGSVSMSVTLNAGNNTIKFHNPGSNAPDLDRITVL